jgi:hypothetical protein
MVILCLGLLVVTLVLARLSTPGPSLRIAGVTLPSVCAFRNATGLPCPGCGLTRSWVELARGDLAASVARNRMGWLLMLWVAAQLIRHGTWLVLARARRLVEAVGGWLDRSLILIGIAMVISWIVTLAQIARGTAAG